VAARTTHRCLFLGVVNCHALERERERGRGERERERGEGETETERT